MSPFDPLVVAKQSLQVISPEILLIAVATAMMTAGAFVRLPRRAWSITSAAALVAALGLLVLVRTVTPDPYGSPVVNDPLSGYARLGFLLAGLVLLALAHDQVDDARSAEFFGSILLIQAGAMLVAASNELVLMFASLELVSIPTYLILYLPRRTEKTLEAATKYFYLSILSSGLLLFGMAYLYGMAGVTNLKAMNFLVHWSSNVLELPTVPFGLIALVFVLAGLGFRCAAVPFHFYAPDVYQGSPTVIAALLAWVPKGVGFVAILRVLTSVFGQQMGGAEGAAHVLAGKAIVVAWMIAVATMTLGNTVALTQQNLKRLLAYSSIAHAGYLMVGVAAAFGNGPNSAEGYLGAQGIVFYLAAYALMTLGAFGVILALSTPTRSVETVDDFAGLAQSQPIAALAMALCLFSLAGVPPLVGFYGKFSIFASAWAAGTGDHAWWFRSLTVIGVLNAAIGAYYYLRIVVKMYFEAPVGEPIQPRPGWPTVAAVGACSTLSLILGIVPGPVNTASREAAVAVNAAPDPSPPAARVDGGDRVAAR